MELFTPDFGLIFWMFVAFGVLFLVLWKFAWPVILKTVDSRAELIDKGVEYAQNKEAQQQFRNQVSEFALEVAGQLVHRQLSGDKAQENLVDNILDDLERKN